MEGYLVRSQLGRISWKASAIDFNLVEGFVFVRLMLVAQLQNRYMVMVRFKRYKQISKTNNYVHSLHRQHNRKHAGSGVDW